MALQRLAAPQANLEEIAKEFDVVPGTLAKWARALKQAPAEAAPAAPGEQTKVCTGCGVDKPLSAYHLHPKGKFGRNPKCKVCSAAARVQRNTKKLKASLPMIKLRDEMRAIAKGVPGAPSIGAPLNGNLQHAMVYLKRAREIATKEHFKDEAFLCCMTALSRLERKEHE